MDRRPLLGLLIISLRVSNVISFVDGGKITASSSINVSCIPEIGIYGISVKKTMVEGKNAKKKLKANDDALVVIAPLVSPFQKKIVTS